MLVLIFNINNNKYAVDVSYIHEAILRQGMTPMAGMADFVAGETNVRGTLYTCVDLSSMLFGIRGKWSKTQIFLLASCDNSYVSMIVDSVDNVITINEKDIDTSMLQFVHDDTRLMDGIFRYKDNLVSLVDIKSVVGTMRGKG